MKCRLCPRECGADRTQETGRCGTGEKIKVGFIGPHFFEEPVISGTKGSGALFFAGCSLGCCYCQNRAISGGNGKEIGVDDLSREIATLAKQGVHNIDLITAGHYLPYLQATLTAAKATVRLPFIYNSGGYEKTAALRLLDDVIDVYLPDFKYLDSRLAARFSSAPDYPAVAKKALAYMYKQAGPLKIENGLAVKGMIIRHLVLPPSFPAPIFR